MKVHGTSGSLASPKPSRLFVGCPMAQQLGAQRQHKHKDSTMHYFGIPSFGAVEPECRILILLWSLGTLILVAEALYTWYITLTIPL